MKIVGLACGAHDTAYCIFENGKVLIHEEYERFSRIKEQQGDVLSFLFERNPNLEDVDIYSHFFMKWNGGLKQMYPDSFSKLEKIIESKNKKYLEISHHLAHAANAFFSSNFEKSIILSLDGGGEETQDGINKTHESSFCLFYGEYNKIYKILDLGMNLDIGGAWSKITKEVFGLSSGPPIGNQCGTIMAMAAIGNEPEKYENDISEYIVSKNTKNFEKWKVLDEKEKYNLAASLQKSTEKIVLNTISSIIIKFCKERNINNLCITGGVALNGLLNYSLLQKIEEIKNIYIPPVPYDAGLAIGCCQYIYYSYLNNKRDITEINASPYLGKKYHRDFIFNEIEKSKLQYTKATNEDVVKLLSDQKIISIFNEGSESGRRALGNRSILADPRNLNIKDILNSKIKHRQWFRPFAPMILREYVHEWFESDLESPYMNIIMPIKKEKQHLVPAIVHFDGTGRLQTVKKTDNEWLYDLLIKWNLLTGIPILLNTSFNDREPIVETPEHAINCYLKTKIDYLFFPEIEVLIHK